MAVHFAPVGVSCVLVHHPYAIRHWLTHLTTGNTQTRQFSCWSWYSARSVDAFTDCATYSFPHTKLPNIWFMRNESWKWKKPFLICLLWMNDIFEQSCGTSRSTLFHSKLLLSSSCQVFPYPRLADGFSLRLIRAPEYLLTTTISSNLMSGSVREYIIENKIYCYRYNHK